MSDPASATLDATSPARPGEDVGASSGDVAAVPETLLEAGERAGDFVIEAMLGRGSFGTVYRAAHAVIGRRGAVKVLRDKGAEPRKVEAFIEEARLVARLRHPNIVDVLGFGQLDDGRHFQVMDFIDGPTLADHLREHGRLPLADAAPILRGIAAALDAVHGSGVIHRDLKPANVVLERRGKELIPKLIDFGIAELSVVDCAATPTARGPAGTPRYMAPEQCRGEVVGARADSYAFGVLVYEMLTGTLPFSGADALELMLRHTSDAPPVPSVRCDALPAEIDPILLALLEKNPADRPTDLEPIVERLAEIARLSHSESDAPARVDSPAPAMSSRLIVMGAGLLAVLAVAAVLAMQLRASPPTPSDLGATAESVSPAAVPLPEARAADPASPPAAAHGAAPAPSSSVPQPSAADSRRRAPLRKRPKGEPSESTGGPSLEDTENPFGAR